MKAVIHVNETSFKSEVLDPTKPVLVDFWAEWCVPCQAMAPLLEEIGHEQAGRVKIVKVNVDESPVLAEHYHIETIPTLIYFLNGLVHDQIVGLADKQEIVAKLAGMGATVVPRAM